MIGKRFNVGTIAGIPFRVSLLWIFVFVFATYTLSHAEVIERYLSVVELVTVTTIETPLATSEAGMVAFSLALVLTLYGSVLLHELGHVYGALKNNVGVEGITLWVLGGAAHISEQPEDPRAEFELTVAGPLVSLALGVVSLILAYASGPLNIPVLTAYFFLTALLNLGMLALNLIPAFPLDGGRLLRSAFTAKYGYERGTMYATTVGKGIAVSVAFVSFLTLYLWGILLAGFVFLAARGERKRVQGNAFRVKSTSSEEFAFQGQTFVFETDIGEYNLPDIASTISEKGGAVGLHVTDETDFIVVPLDDMEMYHTIAKHHDALLLSDEMLEAQLKVDAFGSYRDRSKLYEDTTKTNTSERGNGDDGVNPRP